MSSQRLLNSDRLIKNAVRFSTLIILAFLAFAGEALAAPPETMPIWRAQVFFETFNTSDAGSDDSVRVELNVNNGTWVDSGFDDWEIGSRTYDLRMDGISRVSDIDYFRVSKTGSGGWCIGRIRLIINGVALYDEVFPSGHWLDNCCGHSTVYFIDDFFLRQRSQWISYVVPTRSNIVPVGDMRSRIQCLFGDYLTASDDLGFRNSNPITVSTLDANTWRVNVDLDDIKPGPVPDPDIDVDFDLTVLWNGSLFMRPDLRVENLHVGYTWPGWGEPARNFMNTNFQPRINEMMKNFTYQIGTGIQLAPNGDLHFLPIVISPPIKDFTMATAAGETGDRTATQIPEYDRPELGLRVRTGGETDANAERAFIATVSSGLEDSDVNVIFSLPAEIVLTSNVVEASDREGARRLMPEVESQDDGTTTIKLHDRAAAGKTTNYTLRIMFKPAEDRTANIITRVLPATERLADGARSLHAVTSFRFHSGTITPEGTVCVASEGSKE